jgi:hypothetical protein
MAASSPTRGLLFKPLFLANAAAARRRVQIFERRTGPDIDQIGVADAIRKHPGGADDARLSPRHAFCAGDADRKIVLKRALQLLARTAVVKTVGGK